MQLGLDERQCTLEKSVPAATAAVSSVQRSFIPFSSSSKQRAVCAASSLDGARMTAPGPFTASQLPFRGVSELPFAACFLPSAGSTSPAAFADACWPFESLLPAFAVCRVCIVGKEAAPSGDEPAGV